jgi:hypothetical protein
MVFVQVRSSSFKLIPSGDAGDRRLIVKVSAIVLNTKERTQIEMLKMCTGPEETEGCKKVT